MPRLKRARLVLTAVTCAVLLLFAPLSSAQDEASRERWQRVPDILHAMGVRPGAVVADIGAGDGFFTVRLARAVGDSGRVYAVDISERQLQRLQARIEREGLRNVSVIRGDVDDPKLEPGSLDAALIVNAYHEMTAHQAVLGRIRSALRPDGRLIVVEPIAEARRSLSREQQVANHEIGVEHVERESRDAGFHVSRLEDPFTERGTDQEWLLVLTPRANPSSTGARINPPSSTAPPPDDGWRAPELRIGIEDFKALRSGASPIVIDVREGESFRAGHLPNAVHVEFDSVGAWAPRAGDERRPIVTYCS